MALLLVLWNTVSAFYPPTHHTQQCVLKLIETQVVPLHISQRDKFHHLTQVSR